MSEFTPIETVVQQAVARLVALRHGSQVRLLDLTYRIQHPLGMTETVSLEGFPLYMPRAEPDQTPPPTRTDTTDRPTELDRSTVVTETVETGLRGAILALLCQADKPMKACLIARKLGHKEDSHFRTILAKLRREGKLDHYRGRGYWLAARPVPPDPL